MALLYIETTIPSFLTAHLSRDLVMAAHQQITLTWWRDAVPRHRLVVSEAVLDEIRGGDPEAAARRLKAVEGLDVIGFDSSIRDLNETYGRELGLPARAKTDILHLAYAVSYGVDYLVTWNCAHLANDVVIRRLINVNARLGRTTPFVLTPEAMLESEEA